MIKVNLVPGEILAKARQRQLLLQAGFVGAVLAVVLVAISLLHWSGLYRLQNEITYKQSELKRLGPIVAQVEDLEKERDAVSSRLNVIKGLLQGRSYYPLFMSDFVRTVPGGVKVTLLTTSGPAAGVLKLSIGAMADTNDDVANWMRALEKSGRFASVELGPVAASGRQYSFTITTAYTLKL
jgi:Tfp pilus assembly protein PilN